MNYDWSKPFLIIHPNLACQITNSEKEHGFGFWVKIRELVNVFVTNRITTKEEAWLIPADEIRRLTNLSLNGLYHQISQFNKNSEEVEE